ncbi:MAG: hypothetical protein JWN48_3846 [Myxococcaceae bacterium]|nr:hypothetical protein [Myxococcaceae bacterium]
MGLRSYPAVPRTCARALDGVRRKSRSLAVATLLLAAIWPALDTAAAGERVPLRDGDAVDEIGLARIAEEAGDAQLAARILAPSPRQQALVAVRASLHARAPEALLPALAKLACGRDPVLAPEAARACFEIAAHLSADALARREVLRSDLRAARTALQCSERAPAPRADISAWLAQAGAALDALLR